MSDKKELLQKGVELATPLISQWVLPKVKELLNSSTKKLSLKAKEVSHDYYKNRFETYLSERYTKFFVLETLVFPNHPTLFDDLYYPLTVSTGHEVFNDSVSFVIDGFNNDFLPKYQRVLIQDSAGMGKSTVLRKIFLSCIRENKGFPMLIELRKLNKSNTVVQEILTQLGKLNENADKSFVIKLVERGDFVFLFDGLDEIAFENRDLVLKDILKFIEKAGNNLYMISSRPESVVNSFKEFQKLTISELSQEEAFLIFKNYDKYNSKKVADDLIEILSVNQMENVSEFLKNPFLASLVYKTFSYKRDIPKQKEQFYRKVYDALYEEHDLSKEGYYQRDKFSNLGIDDFEKILRCIGYKTMKLSMVEFTKNELLEMIKAAKRFCIGLEFNESDFLKDMVNTVPLFKIEGLSYKWIHKSYGDYFAARFIICDAEDKINDTIKGLLDESIININVLDFLSSMAPKKFKHIVLNSLIDEFLTLVETKYAPHLIKNYGNDMGVLIWLLHCNQFIFGLYKYSGVQGGREWMNSFDKFRYEVVNNDSSEMSMPYIRQVSVNSKYILMGSSSVNDEINGSLYRLIKLRFPKIFIEYEEESNPLYISETNPLKDEIWGFILRIMKVDCLLEVNDFYKVDVTKDLSYMVNLLLVCGHEFVVPVFNYSMCIEMKEEIKNEIANENKAVDFF